MSVIAVITKEDEIEHILPWGAKFAKAKKSPFIVVHPTRYPQAQAAIPVDLDESSSIPFLETLRTAICALEDEAELIHTQGPDRLQMMLQFIKEHDVQLVVTGHSSMQEEAGDPSLRKGLFEHAPCDVILMRAGEQTSTDCQKVIVPASGGPHATAALQLASQFVEQTDTQVKAIYIEQEAGEYAEALGERILRRVLNEAEVKEDKQFTTGVILADDVQKGILKATQEEGNVDLLLLGASNLGWVQRTLFGSIPERFLAQKQPMTIAVMRAHQPLVQRTRVLFTRIFERVIPQLSREERINLFEHLQTGSHASIDFIALICLSTAIAAFGLLQNSGAVIIGAMLVAPLMTPMLGMGLGLVQGNIMLVKRSVFAICVGFLLSFTIGLGIGLFTPSFHTLTAEMLARGAPNLLDLLVALLSGVAAAYALARPGLLEALPGVAIAAALVPPIATAGASLALGRTDNAIGAASLFGVNLVCIILASAGTLYTLGVRANQKQKRLWARRILITLSLISMLIAFPLGTALLSRIPSSSRSIQKALHQHLSSKPKLTLASLHDTHKRGVTHWSVRVYTPSILTPQQAYGITQTIQKLQPKARVRVISELITLPASSNLRKNPRMATPPPRQTSQSTHTPTTRPTQRTHAHPSVR